MPFRLYVGNLAEDTTAESLRARFSECGVVLDVQIATDRHSDEPRGFAFVTMEKDTDANLAIARFNGYMIEGRAFRVNHAPERDREGSADASSTKAAKSNAGVRIAQQFREKGNMTYDLDCAGVPLTVRIFPVEEKWRIEARTNDTTEAVVVVSAAAPTRADALRQVAQDWSAQAAASSLPSFDWDAITRALTAVRAV